MAITTYSELKSAVSDWMARSDLSGSAADFIALAEARLNRKLDPVETDATLTATIDSREVDVSVLTIDEPLELYLKESGEDEIRLTKRGAGTFPFLDDSGEPEIWSLDDTTIKFDRPANKAYSLRFRYRGRFVLSDSATTNWLLTNHPDIYLAASIVWGKVYIDEPEGMVLYKSILEEGIPEVRHDIAQQKRGKMTFDPALMPQRYYGYINE